MKNQLCLLAFATAATTACGSDNNDGDGVSPQADAAPVEEIDASTPVTTVRVSNLPEGCNFDVATGAVLPDEDGHYIAVSLTPPSYPFTFTAINYNLSGNENCQNSAAHEVLVFPSETAAPPATPTPASIQTIAIAATNATPGTDKMIARPLPEPITIESGVLVVALQLASGGTGTTLCISSCTQANADQDWWSNAVAPPFTWVDMVVGFGFQTQAFINASGHAGS